MRDIMASKGGRHHIKRINAPQSWNIIRKGGTFWTTKQRPGAHSIGKSMPLITIIKDILKYADNSREAVKIIKAGQVLVDNRVVKDPKFAVGFMDVIYIPDTKDCYRVLYDKKARLLFHKIDGKEHGFKLCRVVGKSMIAGGKLQLNLHDGRNQRIDSGDYKIGDVIKMGLPEQKIEEHFKLEEGSTAYIIGGKHAGETGKIKEVQEGTRTRRPLVVLERDGETFTTTKEYAFVVGKDKSAIDILK